MKKALFFALALVSIATTAQARVLPSSIGVDEPPRCMVADPTSTPLNVRDAPAGKQLGTLKNGTKIGISHFQEDKLGRTWGYAIWKGQPLEKAKTKRHEGWVIREYVSCELQ